MKVFLLAVLVGFGSSSVGWTQAQNRALVRTHLRVAVTFIGDPSPSSHWQRDRFYTSGGLMVSTFTAKYSTGVNNAIVRGRVHADVLAFLKRTLSEQQIGQQKDCWSDRDPRFAGDEEVIWNGRRGREHRFTVTYAQGPDAGLPKCPEATEKILEALDVFYDVVVATGEVIVHSD